MSASAPAPASPAPAKGAKIALVLPVLALVVTALAFYPTRFTDAIAVLSLLVLLALLGEPLFVMLGGVATLCFVLVGEEYRTLNGLQVFLVEIANLSTKNVLLAIPFFVVSGSIMTAGSIAGRLIAFARALTSWLPGGLAVATVFACVFFAAISGSSPVTVIAIGSLMFPALVSEKYREEFGLGVLTAAGSLGIVIPPSIPMLVYALVASNTAPVDVGEMFLAGFVPGFMLAGMMSAYAVYVGYRGSAPTRRFDIREVGRTFKEGFWSLGLPVVILGGIYSGVFTPTEAAAVSVAYALVVELAIHRQLEWPKLRGALLESGVNMGALLLIMAMSFGLNKFLVEQKIPDLAATWIADQQMSPLMFILAINVLLIFVGCLMDSISALLVIAPLLVPIGHALGIDLVHLGMIFIINLEIGYLTPPIGLNLFVASAVFKRPLSVVVKGALPFLAIMVVGLGLVSYVPTLSLGPVNLFLRDEPVYEPFPRSRQPEPAPTVTPENVAATPTPAEGTGRVLTIQEMMEARKKREQEGAGGEASPVPSAEPEATATPGRVLTIQEMMEARKQREAEAAAAAAASPEPAASPVP